MAMECLTRKKCKFLSVEYFENWSSFWPMFWDVSCKDLLKDARIRVQLQREMTRCGCLIELQIRVYSLTLCFILQWISISCISANWLEEVWKKSALFAAEKHDGPRQFEKQKLPFRRKLLHLEDLMHPSSRISCFFYVCYGYLFTFCFCSSLFSWCFT